MHKLILLAWLGKVLFLFSAAAQDALPPDVQTAKDKYQKMMDKNFDAMMAGKKKIKAAYLKVMDKEIKDAQSAGKLHDLVKLQKRRDAIAGMTDLELTKEDPESGPYQSKLQDAEEDKAKADKKATLSYRKYLKKKIAEFTKAGKVDVALAFDTEYKRTEKIVDNIEDLPFMQKKLTRQEKIEEALGYKLQRHPTGAKPAPYNAKDEGFKGHWYMVIRKTMNWKQALQYCKDQGGYLACVTSKEENEFLTKYGFELANKEMKAWFGATDEKKEGVWEWISGEQFSFSNWNQHEPSNDGGIEHYMKIVIKSRAGSNANWYDNNNGLGHRAVFICEWEF